MTVTETPRAGAGSSGRRGDGPAAVLSAWRDVERQYAAATPGTDVAGALHAEMRRLMDEYEWQIRGSVPRGDSPVSRSRR